MTYGPKAPALAKQFEGCRLTAYDDGGGTWTLAYGHTRGVQEGDTCTPEQSDAWLDQDLTLAASDVSRLIDVTLNQNEFDALVDFVFNLGYGAFENSILRKLINEGQTLAAAAQFSQWDHIGMTVSAGLLRRRLAERDLFLEAM